MYLNKAYIIGNLTRDPELRALPSGIKVCSFAVATSRVYKDKEGVKKETTEFHNVSAFAKLGELAGQYLKKGQQVLVEGRIQTRSWETNGEKKYRTEIIAENIQFGMKPAGSGAAKGPAAPAGDSAKGEEAPAPAGSDIPSDKIDYPQDEINPDDIPF
jgi:single-strand DNA-binding protein